MAESHDYLSDADRKVALIAELAQARSQMSGSFRDTQGNLEAARAVTSRKALWLTGAVAGGWLLGKLTGKKSKRSKKSNGSAPVAIQQVERTGWALALLGTVGTMLRPAVTSYLTHRLNDYLTRSAGGHNGHGPLR